MINVVTCLKCDSKPIVKTDRLSPSRNQGNKKRRPIHRFYVECPNCFRMGEWFNSSTNKAIRDWNKKNKRKKEKTIKS